MARASRLRCCTRGVCEPIVPTLPKPISWTGSLIVVSHRRRVAQHRIGGANFLRRFRRCIFLFLWTRQHRIRLYRFGSRTRRPDRRRRPYVARAIWLASSCAPCFWARQDSEKFPAAQTSDAILARFRALSGEIADGSSTRLFYRDMSQGLMRLYLRDMRAALRQSGLRGVARKAGRVRLRHVKRLVRAVVP